MWKLHPPPPEMRSCQTSPLFQNLVGGSTPPAERGVPTMVFLYRFYCSCLLDININKNISENLEIYGPLVHNLQILYLKFKFKVAPIVIGTTGYMPKCLIFYLKMVVFDENESKVLISKLEIKCISGTVKKFKTFLNFNDFKFNWLLQEATFLIFMWHKTSNLNPLYLYNGYSHPQIFEFLKSV